MNRFEYGASNSVGRHGELSFHGSLFRVLPSIHSNRSCVLCDFDGLVGSRGHSNITPQNLRCNGKPKELEHCSIISV